MNCTEWHFLRVYDNGSKINPNISSGIIAYMHHTIFCGNQMLRNVPQFLNKSASLYKNMTPRNVFLLCYRSISYPQLSLPILHCKYH